MVNALGQSQSLLSSNILRLLLLTIQVAGLQGVANPPCSKSIGAAGTWTRVFRLHDRRSTNWATDHAGRNEWNNFDWWLLSFTANMALQPTNLGSQYIMKVRIHNNNEGRGQHPELTGQRLRTKSVTSQFKHSPTSTPEHPSSWITAGLKKEFLQHLL